MEKPPIEEQIYYRNALNNKRYNSSVSSIFWTSGLFRSIRSNFFKKTKLINHQTFTIKGLERSGTGFITNVLSKNLFNLTVVDDRKHLFLNGTKEVSRLAWESRSEYPNDTIILCVKNPYSWYISYFEYWNRDKETRRRLEKHKYFCDRTHSCGMIKMWNVFYRSHLEQPNQTFVIKYEDLLLQPKKVIDSISNKFSISKTRNFYNIERYINNYSGRQTNKDGSFSRKEYFLSKKYLEKIGLETINDIEESLDKELLDLLGYSKEP
jgi:hypothetical protein